MKGGADWARSYRECFLKGFMVLAGYSYSGRLEIRKIAKNAMVNAEYYQTNILDEIYRDEIPALYTELSNIVEIHQEKASSHTARSSLAYYELM
jgi:hypothetical protein